jgi:hypothetical protein
MYRTARIVFIQYGITPCSKNPYLLWGLHALVFKEYLGDLERE